jgi:hypothetical protein
MSNPYSYLYPCKYCGAAKGDPCVSGAGIASPAPNGYHISRYPANGYLSDSDGATMQFLTNLIVRGDGR